MPRIVSAFSRAAASSLNPDYKAAYAERGLAFCGLGDLESARLVRDEARLLGKSAMSGSGDGVRQAWPTRRCGSRTCEYQGVWGRATAAYNYVTIHAQWGDRPKALEWLDTAMRLRDGWLEFLKTDPLLIPCATSRASRRSSGVSGKYWTNGIFEFNITRLWAYIGVAGRFHAELTLDDIAHATKSACLSELTIVAADLSRPVILAEIAPGRYNLIDGHHRVAKARREGVPSIPAYRIPCPEHVAFLTSTRAYEAYVEYWNSKVHDASGNHPPAGAREVPVAVVRLVAGKPVRRWRTNRPHTRRRLPERP